MKDICNKELSNEGGESWHELCLLWMLQSQVVSWCYMEMWRLIISSYWIWHPWLCWGHWDLVMGCVVSPIWSLAISTLPTTRRANCCCQLLLLMAKLMTWILNFFGLLKVMCSSSVSLSLCFINSCVMFLHAWLQNLNLKTRRYVECFWDLWILGRR